MSNTTFYSEIFCLKAFKNFSKNWIVLHLLLCSRRIIDAVLQSSGVWIGLNDKNNEGVFVWIDGINATANNIEWKTNEPNNSGQGEDCAVMNWSNRKTNDLSCEKNKYGLCEQKIDPLKVDVSTQRTLAADC